MFFCVILKDDIIKMTQNETVIQTMEDLGIPFQPSLPNAGAGLVPAHKQCSTYV